MRFYLEGQGDLVSRLITPINHVVTLFISKINLSLLSPNDLPSRVLVFRALGLWGFSFCWCFLRESTEVDPCSSTYKSYYRV